MGKAKAKGLFAVLLSLALALTALAGLTGCSTGSTPTGSQTLKVGVRSDVVGFGYYNEETGKYYGLEIDIANEVAQRLGYSNVEFVSVLPENRKEMLMNGEVDCLCACYSISDTRLENFDFTPAYYDDAAVVMVENSSLITDIDGLKGLTFGAMMGTNTAPQLVEKLTSLKFTNGKPVKANEDESDVTYDNLRLVQLDSYEAVSNALEKGEIDAACMDGSIVQTYMRDNRSLLDFEISSQQYGIATNKGTELSGKMSETVQGMIDDGTIAALTDKWD